MKRAEHQPEQTDICIYAGIFMKTWHVKDAGTFLPQHSHRHPHISHIVSGSVSVWCGDTPLGDFVAPATVKIPAEKLHSFLTLTNNVVIACIHNADHLEGEEPEVAQYAHVELEG